MSTIEFAEAFAGPLATILAAIAAVFVTWRFNSAQVEIARQQKDISLDKLKFDIFEKRYRTYQTAKSLLSYVTLQHDIEKINSTKIRDWRIELDEARFFFGKDILAFIKEIDDASESLLNHLAERMLIDPNDDQKWHSTAETLAKDTQRLRQLYAACIDRFESALSFKLLKE